MVRLLVCANEFDIEGLIVSTGCWKKSQSDTKMLDKIVDAYGKALPNLRVHAEGYPSVESLRSISVMGQTGLRHGRRRRRQGQSRIGPDHRFGGQGRSAPGLGGLLGWREHRRTGDLESSSNAFESRVIAIPRQAARVRHPGSGRRRGLDREDFPRAFLHPRHRASMAGSPPTTT